MRAIDEFDQRFPCRNRPRRPRAPGVGSRSRPPSRRRSADPARCAASCQPARCGRRRAAICAARRQRAAGRTARRCRTTSRCCADAGLIEGEIEGPRSVADDGIADGLVHLSTLSPSRRARRPQAVPRAAAMAADPPATGRRSGPDPRGRRRREALDARPLPAPVDRGRDGGGCRARVADPASGTTGSTRCGSAPSASRSPSGCC